MLHFRSFVTIFFSSVCTGVFGCGGSESKKEIAALKKEVSTLKAQVEKDKEDSTQKANEVKRSTIEKPKSVVESEPDNIHQALNVVSTALGYNTLNVKASDLRAIDNSKGEGVFIYVPKTRFRDVERYIIWMVIDGKAYALNGPTKKVTPNLPWPRDAPKNTWKKTGLDMYMATEAIGLVFGK